ncbi:Transposon TX1 uncharacterized protein [Merluccius polli]|uniref:Transposon TX1 uncharacterized protein n=1 Tax=Merluccius polli TaxID=89951 RepID=A0AA47M9W1_MERPO|nr:Transposon TX1 uncharacterized protein [Merluccius polli]
MASERSPRDGEGGRGPIPLDIDDVQLLLQGHCDVVYVCQVCSDAGVSDVFLFMPFGFVSPQLLGGRRHRAWEPETRNCKGAEFGLEGFHMVYVSSRNRKCFECGDVGHKRIACPHKQRAEMKGRADGERLLPQLSCRGRVLVANNLVTSTLWHRLIVLPPPRSLIEEVQRTIVNLFWSGQHWIRAAALYLPVNEGGQGLVDIPSRVLAFRLQAAQRFLYHCGLSWLDTARLLQYEELDWTGLTRNKVWTLNPSPCLVFIHYECINPFLMKPAGVARRSTDVSHDALYGGIKPPGEH